MPYQGLSPVRGNSPAGFLGGGVVVTPPCYPTGLTPIAPLAFLTLTMVIGLVPLLPL